MKKTVRIITAVVLALSVILCAVWYLLVYDREFTRDILLSCARGFESSGSHGAATWFYNLAYNQSDNGDSVAIELAMQYKRSGNYTKAEYTLYNAISKNAGPDVYIALSQLYVEQDKLLDAVTMLNNVANPTVKEKLDAMRPAPPTSDLEQGLRNTYAPVNLASDHTIYYSTDDKYPSTQGKQFTSPLTLVEGSNKIQAIAVDKNGLVSQLATFEYTIGGVIELVEFNDTVMEAEIRKLLNLTGDSEVYTNQLWEIKTFTIPEGVADYRDLRYMTFLESLTIQNGTPEQLSCLEGLEHLTELVIKNTSVSQDALDIIAVLPKLSKLTISSCSLHGLKPLEQATKLTYLDLSENNSLRDISPLSALKNLQELNLQGNAVKDLTPLSGSTAMVNLNISHNAITSLAPISTLTALTRLDANTNLISELGEINELTALTHLSLSANNITDISKLGACTNLTELDISSNSIADISALSSLTLLQTFNFSHNQVTALPEFSRSSALVVIDGSYNQVSTLEPLRGLKKLNEVNMDYNEKIKSVSPLADCPSLIEVNVYGTGVKDVKALTAQSVVVNYNPV